MLSVVMVKYHCQNDFCKYGKELGVQMININSKELRSPNDIFRYGKEFGVQMIYVFGEELRCPNDTCRYGEVTVS